MSREKRAEMCARSMRCRARSPHAPPRRAVKSSQRTTGLRAPKARRVVGRERTVAVMGASFREGSARLPDASEARCLFGSLALAVRVRVRPDRSATGLAGSVPPTRGRASRANPGRISPARSGSIWFGELGAGRMVPGGAAPDWGSRAGIVRLASGSVMRDSSRQSDFRRLLLSNRDMMVRRGHHTAGPRGARDAPSGTACGRARRRGVIARRSTSDRRPPREAGPGRCPNLLQRPGSHWTGRKRSLIFRGFFRERWRLAAPLQQIWTDRRPDQSHAPHAPHSVGGSGRVVVGVGPRPFAAHRGRSAAPPGSRLWRSGRIVRVSPSNVLEDFRMIARL